VGGRLTIFDFYAPFKVQTGVRPKMDMGSIGVAFFLQSSLEPSLHLLEGEVYVKAKGHIGITPFKIGFSVSKTVFKFEPLIKLDFGNIIPLKPIEFDLLTIGEGVKVLGK